MSKPNPGVFGRFIKGTGLTPQANFLSFLVAFGGAAAWWWWDATHSEKAKLEFKQSEQNEWNKQVLDKQRAEDERKKRLATAGNAQQQQPTSER